MPLLTELDARAFSLINGLARSKVEGVNNQCRSATFRCSIITLVTLAWSCLAFSGEIHDAAKNGDLEKVKTLLKDNPDLVFSTNNVGLTPLHWAAFIGSKDMVELLLANKAMINAKSNQGMTPLHLAIFNHQKEVVDLLLTNKAEITIHDAAEGGYLEKVKEQIKANPSLVFSKNQLTGATPLIYAAMFRRKEIVEYLLANKADVNAVDNDGKTSLHFVVRKNYSDLVELLLVSNADVNVKDKVGKTPLRIAMDWQNNDLAELLRQHGGHE